MKGQHIGVVGVSSCKSGLYKLIEQLTEYKRV